MPSQDFFFTVASDGTGTVINNSGHIGGTQNSNSFAMFALATPPGSPPATTTTQPTGFAADPCASGDFTELPVETYLVNNALPKQYAMFFQTLLFNNFSAKNPTCSARLMIQLVYRTGLGSIFKDLLTVHAHVLSMKLCARARVLTLDTQLQKYYTFADNALQELSTLKVPDAYLAILRANVQSEYFEDRVAAICAIVLLSGLIAMQG